MRHENMLGNAQEYIYNELFVLGCPKSTISTIWNTSNFDIGLHQRHLCNIWINPSELQTLTTADTCSSF